MPTEHRGPQGKTCGWPKCTTSDYKPQTRITHFQEDGARLSVTYIFSKNLFFVKKNVLASGCFTFFTFCSFYCFLRFYVFHFFLNVFVVGKRVFDSLDLIWCEMWCDGMEQRGTWHETEHGYLWMLVGMDLYPVASVTVLLTETWYFVDL